MLRQCGNAFDVDGSSFFKPTVFGIERLKPEISSFCLSGDKAKIGKEIWIEF